MSNQSVPAVYSTNSDSPSNQKTTAAAGMRVKAGGLNLPVGQAISIPVGVKHETLIIPSSSTPSFSGFFTIDIRQKNILLNNITLQFNVSPISGTNVTGYFNPAHYFFQRIEVIQNSNVIDTIYGNQQFLLDQLLYFDEQRLSLNQASGLYSSPAQRTLLSSTTTTNTLYVNLRTYFDQTKVALLTDQHQVQLRVYMDSFANVFTLTGGSNPSATINSCNAILKVTTLDQETAGRRLQDMTVSPHHHIFHDVHYGTFSIPQGNLSSTIVLAPITGNVATLMFVVRSSTIGAQAWIYSQLASFALLSSSSENIVGGQVLPASLCANVLNTDWCKSTYNTETAFGVNNQGANVYIWSFSADPISALSYGQALTSRKMTGQEQLVLNFTAPLAAQVQVDVYAYVESILEVSPSSVKKISL